MSTNLLDRIETTNAEQRKQSLTEYRAILNRIDEPQDGDEDSLKRCMQALGITEADVRQDRAALVEVQRAEGYIIAPDVMERWHENARGRQAKFVEGWAVLLSDVLKMVPIESYPAAYQLLMPLLPLSDAQFALLQGRERNLSGGIAAIGDELRNRARKSQESEVQAKYLRQNNPRVFGPA